MERHRVTASFCILLAASLCLGQRNATKCKQTIVKGNLQVDCSKLQLTHVPTGIPSETWSLDLSDNNLATLQGLQNLTKLFKLIVTNNELSSWESDWLSNTEQLSVLKLSQNKLSKPPAVCESAPSLTELWLNANPIKGDFGNEFAECTMLESLTLSETHYAELTNNTLAGLANSTLKTLRINSLPKLKSVQPDCLKWIQHSLQTLDLQQNKALDEKMLKLLLDATSFTQLLHLQLGGTSVGITDSTFASCSAAATLETLMLDSTPLSELSVNSLTPLKKLTSLSFSKTNVAGWPAGTFESLGNLQLLDLRQTQLTTIGGRNGSVNPLPLLNSKLQTLKLSGANISCDCNLLWLSENLQSTLMKSKLYEPNKTLCAQPQSVKDTPILQFKPQDCNPAPAPDERMSRLVFVLAILGGVIATVVVVAVAIAIAVRSIRAEGPRLLLDDDCDPLMAPGQRRSIWIRLRRLLSPASRTNAPRPPIFTEPAPEDFLSEDA